MLRRLLTAALLAILCACGGGGSSGDIQYRVTSPNGGVADPTAMALTCTELKVRLAEYGIDRSVVTQLGADKIRVVLPDNVASQHPEIRKALEKPDGLKVSLQYITPK